MRLAALLKFVKDHPEYECEILLAAGSHPAYADYPLLKSLTAKRLDEHLHAAYNAGTIGYMPAITLIEPDVWNTSNESLAVALFLEKHDIHELFVVSSKTHENRIMYIWSLIGGFTIHFVGAKTKRYWRSVFYELFAMIKVFIKDRKLLRKRQFATYQAAKSLAINY